VLDLIEQPDIIPPEYFKKLKGSDDIWEVRVQYGNNIFRLLGFFEVNNIVILNHAFTKKTQKTPLREINTAEKRKREYLRERGLI
jgi:phage-related protein